MLRFTMGMPLQMMALYGSLMILVVLFLRLLLKKRLPPVVFPVLWGLVLVRLLVPFSLSSPLSAPLPSWLQQPFAYSSNAATISNTVVQEVNTTALTKGTQQATEVLFEQPDFGPMMVVIVFVLGFAATAGLLLAQKRRVDRQLKDSLLVEQNATIGKVLAQAKLHHVLVMTNDHIASPLVKGIWNPCIYLPAGMDFANTTVLGHVMLHEAMHIRRKDNLFKLVLLVVLCLHWYNPLVWLMAKMLCADLETACDAAVLHQSGEEQKQEYAYSLLTMAVAGRPGPLLYSAFSKTEVERRIKGVLQYRKTTLAVLAVSVVLLLCSGTVFATVGQAPFENSFSSFCASTNSRWGAKVYLTRDITAGANAQKRVDTAVLQILAADQTADPEQLSRKIAAALSAEFGVEQSAFSVKMQLCPTEEALAAEYAAQGLVLQANGRYLYRDKLVREYEDLLLGSVQTNEDGEVDIAVERDDSGNIVAIQRKMAGDASFDQRTKAIELEKKTRSTTEGGVAVTQETLD